MNKNMSASNFPALPRSTVTVRNAGETTLPAWSAAAPVAGSDNRFSGSELFFDVIPASPSDRFWGVLTENISPGCCGTMVVNGVVPALIGEDEGIGEYAVPGENGLLPGSSGRAELLRRPGSSGEPTRERVRQIETKAFNKFKHPTRLSRIKQLFNNFL